MSEDRELFYLMAEAWHELTEAEKRSLVVIAQSMVDREAVHVIAEPEPEPDEHICPRCNGQGKIRDPLYRELIDCGQCDGRGFVVVTPESRKA